MGTETLRNWLRNEVATVLNRRVSPPPLPIWCDRGNAWRELLRAAAEGGVDERRWRREGKLPQPGWWSMGADSA